MTPWYAIGLGRHPAVALIAAGVSVIVEAKLSSGRSYLALALFCVIATSSILALEDLRGFRPKPAQDSCPLRHWIDTHTGPGHHHRVPGTRLLGWSGTAFYYLIT